MAILGNLIPEPEARQKGSTLLDASEIVWGGEVEGEVYFQTPRRAGAYYILYKPDPFEAARGIWRLTL